MPLHVYESPFTVPPPVFLREILLASKLPEGFSGRVGVLAAQSRLKGERKILFAIEPVARGFSTDYRYLSPDDLWPSLADSELPDIFLINGLGKEIPIRDVLSKIFENYPDLPPDRGGAIWDKRKAQWRFAIVEGLRSPTVALLNRFNSLKKSEPAEDWTLLGTAEMWAGASTAHEVRHDRCVIAPKSSVKYLVDALLEGLPHEDARPIVTGQPDVPVLFEDEAIIVINKPARLASVPGVREIVSAKSLLEREKGPLRIVHRLDTDTSGILVFAKTISAEKRLHEVFRGGLALKRYVARLEGIPMVRAGTISLPIALNALDRPRQCILSESAGGKSAFTDWEVLRVETMPDGKKKALVNLWPETGRTHQLRLHCAHVLGLNLPIDGDSFYGSRGLLAEDGTTRLCLHAAELTFPHPVNEEILTFETAPDFPLF